MSSIYSILIDTIINSIVPKTKIAISEGNKIFGAAILQKRDYSLITVGTNNEIVNPLSGSKIKENGKEYNKLIKIRDNYNDVKKINNIINNDCSYNNENDNELSDDNLLPDYLKTDATKINMSEFNQICEGLSVYFAVWNLKFEYNPVALDFIDRNILYIQKWGSEYDQEWYKNIMREGRLQIEDEGIDTDVPIPINMEYLLSTCSVDSFQYHFQPWRSNPFRYHLSVV